MKQTISYEYKSQPAGRAFAKQLDDGLLQHFYAMPETEGTDEADQHLIFRYKKTLSTWRSSPPRAEEVSIDPIWINPNPIRRNISCQQFRPQMLRKPP